MGCFLGQGFFFSLALGFTCRISDAGPEAFLSKALTVCCSPASFPGIAAVASGRVGFAACCGVQFSAFQTLMFDHVALERQPKGAFIPACV